MFISNSHLVDTIQFDLQVQKTVIQEHVRLRVGVVTLAHNKEQDFSKIESRIRAALARFVDVEWQFFRIQRGADAIGYERVQLEARAKILAVDNYNLEERARAASQEGLTLSDPRVDYSLPPTRVGETLKELGEQTLKVVQERMAVFCKLTGRNWRIGEIVFNPAAPERNEYRNPKLAMMEDSSDGALVEAEQVMLKSHVTLKAEPTAKN
jgi:hypothetical protein